MKNTEKLSFKNKNKAMISVGSWKVVEPQQVVMFLAEANYTTIYFLDGEKMIVATPLKALENRFRSFIFFRLHKSYMVNLHFVKDFTSGEIMQVSLKNDFSFVVSRRKRRAFRKEFAMLSVA